MQTTDSNIKKEFYFMEYKRLYSFDYLKAFCIFLVCLGHTIFYILSDSDHTQPVYSYIYAFHMPLFMTVSGFFFVSSLNRSFAVILKEKCVHLLLPCLSFFLIIKIFRLTANLNFWYLKCLFCLYILYWLLFKIQNRLKIYSPIYWGLVIFLFFCVGPFFNRWLIYSYKLLFMFPFFGLGILLRLNWQCVKKYEPYICGIACVLSLVALAFWKPEYIIYFTPIRYISFSGFDMNLLMASLFRWGTGAALSVFFILLFDILSIYVQPNAFVFRSIQNIGKHSLEIYLLQSFMLEYGFASYIKNAMQYKATCIAAMADCIILGGGYYIHNNYSMHADCKNSIQNSFA